MSLRPKYEHAIQTCKGRFDGAATDKDGKLHFDGTVKSVEDKNLIWDAIKTVPTWRDEVVADIRVVEPAAPAAGAASARTYTVQPGDSLSKIAKETLGNASAYMKIFEANKDQLSDPDKIQPGQVLKIPSA